ncbi:MAG: hypothetical protein DRP42_06335 [Tenericutes bacterium]|nr:MAG: hypothetical protein DRP42_06335 [Mycoplasmatota bacterium]
MSGIVIAEQKARKMGSSSVYVVLPKILTTKWGLVPGDTVEFSQDGDLFTATIRKKGDNESTTSVDEHPGS